MKEPTLPPGRWTPARKAVPVLAWLRGWDIARRHGLSQAHVAVWRDRFLTGGQAALKVRQAARDRACERRVRWLQRKVRRLTLENQVLKNRGECRANAR